MDTFMISGRAYFDALSQPVLVSDHHQIVYRNPAALTALPALGLGCPVPEALPAAADAVASLTLGGRRWQVRTFAAEGGILYQFTAEAAEGLTGEEAYSLSVGLKLTMNSMLTAMNALQERLAETELERNREQLAAMNHSYYKLLHSVDSLSFYALAAEDSENLFLPKPMDMTGFCREMLDDLAVLVESTGHSLTLENAQRPLFVHGDARLLKRLVCQLVANAIKAGGDITLRLKAQGRNAILSVIDTGSGISNEMLSSAFDARPVRSGAYACGVGFGLSICKEIARLHGGSLVVSRRKQGTQAALSIPLADLETLNGQFHSDGPAIGAGLDPVLVEMSGVLGDEYYDPAAL